DHLAHGWIGADAERSLPTVPAPLLESAALFLMFGVVSILGSRVRKPGLACGLSGVFYPAWRFVAEFWRGDNLPYWGSTLTFSQGVSVALLVLSVPFLCSRRRRSEVRRPEPRVTPCRWKFAGLAGLLLAGTAG